MLIDVYGVGRLSNSGFQDWLHKINRSNASRSNVMVSTHDANNNTSLMQNELMVNYHHQPIVKCFGKLVNGAFGIMISMLPLSMALSRRSCKL